MRQHEEPRIYIDKEGRRQGTMAKSERPEDMLCDFCSEAHVEFKDYPCKDFYAGCGITSRGWWLACMKCAELIDADDRDGLAVRSVIMLADELKADNMESTRELHAKFFANRIYEEADKGVRPLV